MTPCAKRPQQRTPRGVAKVRYSRTCALPTCRQPFVAKRGGVHYCSPQHANAAKKLRLRMNEPATDPRELGPEEPLIRPDIEGIRRRALDAACDEVASAAMYERFPGRIATWAIAEAKRRGHYKPVPGFADVGFSRLPFGPPP